MWTNTNGHKVRLSDDEHGMAGVAPAMTIAAAANCTSVFSALGITPKPTLRIHQQSFDVIDVLGLPRPAARRTWAPAHGTGIHHPLGRIDPKLIARD